MNSIITTGMSKTVINNKLVEDKQYMGSYDGEKGKLLMRNGNEGVYVELDNNDYSMDIGMTSYETLNGLDSDRYQFILPYYNYYTNK